MWSQEFTRENLKGLLVIFSVLLFVLLIFYLPGDVKDSLVLRSDDPCVLGLFMCHFVHFDFCNHLLPNMVVYLTAALLLYFFLIGLNERILFYQFFAFNCLAMPFLLSLIWILANRLAFTWGKASFGFSGIAAAFLGSLVSAYALFLNKLLKIKTNNVCLSALFLIALLFAITYYTPTVTMTALNVIILACFTITAYKTLRSVDCQAKNRLKEKTKKPVIINLLPILLYLIILASSPALFPVQIIVENTTVNIFLHYMGFTIPITVNQLLWQHTFKR